MSNDKKVTLEYVGRLTWVINGEAEPESQASIALDERMRSMGRVKGPPKATYAKTVEELEKMGLIGWYVREGE